MISQSKMGFPNKASPNPQPRTWVDVWMDRKHDSDSDMDGGREWELQKNFQDGCFLSFVRSDLNSLYFSI